MLKVFLWYVFEGNHTFLMAAPSTYLNLLFIIQYLLDVVTNSLHGLNPILQLDFDIQVVEVDTKMGKKYSQTR